MKLVAMAVFDTKAKAFVTPFFVSHVEVGQRAFSDCANDKTHSFGRNPADYTLFKVGEFDDELGELKPVSPIENFGQAALYVRPKGSTEVRELRLPFELPEVPANEVSKPNGEDKNHVR